jgi:hypothetical protein
MIEVLSMTHGVNSQRCNAVGVQDSALQSGGMAENMEEEMLINHRACGTPLGLQQLRKFIEHSTGRWD